MGIEPELLERRIMIIRDDKGRFVKGSIQASVYNGFYGRKHSEDTIEKIIASRVGKHLSEDHKQKIRLAHKARLEKFGFVNSPEARKKLSETRIRLGLSKGSKSSLWKDGRWSNNPSEYARCYTLARIARKRNAPGSHTLEEWNALKMAYEYTCPSCMKREPEIKLEEDHIVALIEGGSDDISNIQPLCRSCNSRKNKKTIKYHWKENI